MKSLIAVFSVVAALAGAVTACAQEDGPEPATVGVVEEPIGTLITSIDLEAGHVIRIYEVEPGLMVATESGKIGKQARALGREIGSFVEVFKTLAPDQAVPPALIAAEARRDAMRGRVSASRPPDDEIAANGDGFSFYTTGEQDWFRQTVCHPLPVPFSVPKCIQGWDWIDSGADFTSDWVSEVFVGSEGTVAAHYNTYWWKCSGGNCWWEPLGSATVPPGHGYWLSGGGGWYYFKATLTGAGGGTQVSMAIKNGPYNCVHCNDGSCQCGYNVPDNLCRAHSGPDFSVGCIIQAADAGDTQ